MAYIWDRCDILTDSDPPACQHCKQYGFECTFFLPIAETRFKKKKLEEEAAHSGEHNKASGGSVHDSTAPHGESSRAADARVCGTSPPTMQAAASFGPNTADEVPSQALHRKLISCIRAQRFRLVSMSPTIPDTITLGR